MLVKIKQPGWELYTGVLGMTDFVNAVSVTDMTRQEAYALGSHIHIVEIDEYGVEGHQISEAYDLARAKQVRADVVTPFKRQSEIDKEDAVKAAARAADPTAPKIYTRDELEAIASAKGIAGIREISDLHGIKGVAMKTLIEEILVRQRSA